MGRKGPISWIKRALGKGTQSEGPKLVTKQPSRVIIARLPSRYIVDDDAAVSVAQTYGASRILRILAMA
jgi:hypothetical protein